MESSVRNYICTERAHYMCPNMHFGIMARIPADYDAEKVRQSVSAIQTAHPFLRSVIAEEPGSGKLFYQEQETLDIPITEKTDAGFWQRDYDSLGQNGWNVRRESMLKLLVYPARGDFEILFTVHHLLCDGRGLLQLVTEFAKHYVNGIAPDDAGERLIASQEDLPEKSDLPLLSRLLVDDVNRRWDREKHAVSYDEYLDFERTFIRDNPVCREVETIDGKELEAIQTCCRQHGVSVNDYLIARMMLEEETEKVIIAADIRDRLRCYKEGALGNYSTAFSVVTGKKDRKDSNVYELAERVAKRVASLRQEPHKEMLVLACYIRMRPELIDAVAISTLGGFKSDAGAFVGANMFGYAARNGNCVTNLGKVRSDVITDAVFIPPASPANEKTWGVLTINGRMKICSAMRKEA